VGLTVYQAIIDSTLSTMLLTGFSTGLLQLYRFVQFELEVLLKFIVIHLLAGIIVSIFWVNATQVVLFQVFINDPSYQTFFRTNFVTRFFFGLILYFTFTAFIYLIQAYFKNIESIKKEESLKTQLLEAELNVLKLQVNPHFIFNTLNSISALTQIDPALATVMTEKLAKFIRISLENKELSLIPLRDEIENIKRYIEIEQVRFEEKMEVTFTISEETKIIKIPSFILVPVIENAIKHGVQPAINKVKITISTSLEKDHLAITVNNTLENGNPKSSIGLGVGITNVKERLKLHYNESATVSVRNYGNLFSLSISIPLEQV
jgi:sensor histidine kinase YesM